jgi:hypothetical protein
MPTVRKMLLNCRDEEVSGDLKEGSHEADIVWDDNAPQYDR